MRKDMSPGRGGVGWCMRDSVYEIVLSSPMRKPEEGKGQGVSWTVRSLSGYCKVSGMFLVSN